MLFQIFTTTHPNKGLVELYSSAIVVPIFKDYKLRLANTYRKIFTLPAFSALDSAKQADMEDKFAAALADNGEQLEAAQLLLARVKKDSADKSKEKDVLQRVAEMLYVPMAGYVASTLGKAAVPSSVSSSSSSSTAAAAAAAAPLSISVTTIATTAAAAAQPYSPKVCINASSSIFGAILKPFFFKNVPFFFFFFSPLRSSFFSKHSSNFWIRLPLM